MNKLGYSKKIKKSCLALGLSLAVILAPAQAAKLYKWKDKDGVVHYSDKMPPESTDAAHHELDQQGRRRREVERAKTEEERMAEKMEQTQEEQQRRVEAERVARQRMRDQILLQTFTTERDLTMTRDDRINAIDSIINLTISNNNRIVPQIEETKSRIKRIENSGRKVPENIVKRLENLNGQYEKNKGYIELKQAERKELNDGFEADLKRFRELKGIAAESADESAVADESVDKAEEVSNENLPQPEKVATSGPESD